MLVPGRPFQWNDAEVVGGPPLSSRYVLMAPAPLEPVSHLLPFPLAARHRDLPNAAPPAVVEPGQERVLQLQLLPLRLVLFSPSVGEL